ncbi:MAG TPA: uracil-DNA glycosylase, partial [Pseudohongiella sp.]|nr:uracil-DNA glycosylase [Pseudohongiella sp.]
AMIDRRRHLVLSSPHPSPLSAHRGFLGNRHFSKTNQYLQQQQLASIDWQIR